MCCVLYWVFCAACSVLCVLCGVLHVTCCVYGVACSMMRVLCCVFYDACSGCVFYAACSCCVFCVACVMCSVLCYVLFWLCSMLQCRMIPAILCVCWVSHTLRDDSYLRRAALWDAGLREFLCSPWEPHLPAPLFNHDPAPTCTPPDCPVWCFGVQLCQRPLSHCNIQPYWSDVGWSLGDIFLLVPYVIFIEGTYNKK